MTGTYHAGLVLLSIAVAMAASYAALDLAARVVSSRGRAMARWLLGGAFAMGGGIWTMHFIGMLSFRLPVRMAYDLPLTIASLLIAIAASGFALAVVARLAVVNATEADPPVLVASGIIMGAGICAMHYTGMAAMRMAPPIVYTPALFAASMLIAVSASIAALWLAFMSGRGGAMHRLLGAAVMGLAISGMHYTAMAAAVFDPRALCAVPGNRDMDNTRLALVAAGLMLAILGVALRLSFLDRRARTPRLA